MAIWKVRESFANGDRCEGELKGGSFNGQVACNYADGDSYEGGFQNGKKHGVYTFADSTTVEGTWVDGEIEQ